MLYENLNNRSNHRNRPGIVLLVTLVLLVMLSTLGYTLSSRIAAQRHRNQYIIDYQTAHYACDSAARYAFEQLKDMNTPSLIARPNEPDFSDLFWRTEQEYEQYLADWAAGEASDRIKGVFYVNGTNDVNSLDKFNYSDDTASPNSLTVRGPYGPPWPFVVEPVEFEIGSASVRVEIEDENAKYPLGWMLLDDEDVEREALAGFETFCEWADINNVQIDSLKRELKEVGKIKTFRLDFEPIKIREQEKVETTAGRGKEGRRTYRSRRIREKTVPALVHTADFAKLFHSSLMDIEALARPTIVSDSRSESALKYISLWASSKVNINTAPRHVLEAAFSFGGDADKIADEIIKRRRIKPFTDIKDLKESLFKYSQSIEKCEKYITMVSTFFSVRITAVSGVAQASTVIAVIKEDRKVQRIASLSSW